jgi:DNA damage-inducible protein 1
MNQQNLQLNGKILNGDQTSLEKLGIQNNDLITLSVKRIISQPQPQQQNGGLRQMNPFQNIDIVKSSTKEIISYFKNHQFYLLGLPKEFQQAILNNDEKSIEMMIGPMKQRLHHEELLKRLEQDPFDVEAQKLLEDTIQRGNIEENMQNALEHTPESFAQVVMLYINAKVNGVDLRAFVDSGAQMTIMSKACAEKCGLMRLLDTRFHGVAVGVGSAKILGRVHLTQMVIGKSHFPVTITVLDQGGIEFLFGLDMLRRHQCSIDLKNNCLNIGVESVGFLSEKDIPKGEKEHLMELSPKPQETKPTIQKPQQVQFQVNQQHLKTLMEMGFPKEECEKALRASNNNIDAAAGYLFGGQ